MTPASIRLPSVAVEDSFEQSKRSMHSAIHRFMRRYGQALGSYEDCQSHAYELWVDSYNSWIDEPHKRRGGGGFATHLGYWIYYGLIDALRRKLRQRKNMMRDGEREDENTIPNHARSNWKAADFALELGQDAAYVFQLVMETPEEIAAIAEGKGGKPRNYRSSIRNYLRDAGWVSARIAESFKEIQDALQA